MEALPFREALRFWWRLGWTSFGGPAGQIAAMHEELVLRRRWVSEGRFLHALNYCTALPGPEAQQLATYLGWLLHGVRGGIVAGGLFVLPSVLVLTALSWAYALWGSTSAVEGVLAGFRPAVVAVVAYATWRIGRRAVRRPLHLALATGALGALLLEVPFLVVLAVAAAVGLLAHHLAPREGPETGTAARPRAAAGQGMERYLVDDDTPTPDHARPSRARFLRTLGAAAALWAVVFLPLWIIRGAADPLVAMGLFFSGAALVTFGGAYAVLPFVAEVAIESHGWLTTGQMLDGLALGETTPGPLIMVVLFVGFLGAWQTVGPGAGWAGGLVATSFTFLPGFALVFLGGPHVEALRGRPRWTAPLAAVTAAVVGVIAHLGISLGSHALAPGGRVDPFGVALALLCAAALFRFRWPVHWTVLAAGVVGFVASLLGA